MIKIKTANIYLIMLLLTILPYNTNILFFNNYSIHPDILINCVRAFLIIYVLSYVKNINLTHSEKKTIKNISIYFIFILIINVISTSINGNLNLITLLRRSFSIGYMYIFYVYFIYNFKNIKSFFKIFILVVSFLLILSYFVYIFFPSIGVLYEGWDSYAFLGVANNRNSLFELLFPLIVSIYYLYYEKLKLKNIFIILFVILAIFLTKSITSIFTMCIFFVLLLINRIIKNNRNIAKNALIVCLIIWILYFIVVLFNVDIGLISSVFANKSTTFSGRTLIWQKAINFIKEKPIIGYGYDNEIIGNSKNYMQLYNLSFPNDTHNGVLYLLLSSGIIGFVTYMFLFVKSLKCGLNIISLDKKYFYLFAYLISNLIRGITESCFHYTHMFVFIIYIIFTIKYYDFVKKEDLI
ncbi:MAG: O-antigen ligase family protein [Bacilli bacterium]|nr:O-antigen ligase family protein [Bacilli bacterium]MBO6195538.1 O-antigen ligase family protein [Bacilli bacterium]